MIVGMEISGKGRNEETRGCEAEKKEKRHQKSSNPVHPPQPTLRRSGHKCSRNSHSKKCLNKNKTHNNIPFPPTFAI